MKSDIPSSLEVLAGLRDFQRATATYAFSRLYDAERPSLRFLVADEVGLGKTFVARGVIAQVVEHLRGLKDKRIDIVYICSNGAIARQNLRKLNIAGDGVITEADRFTLLANAMETMESREMNLVAVTPGTSLSFGQSAGTFPERALLYAILRRIWGEDQLRGSGAERIFYLGIDDNRSGDGRTPGQRLRDRANGIEPSVTVVRAFREQIRFLNEQRGLEGLSTLKVEFNRLVRAFTYKHGFTQEDRKQRNRFIVELRQSLATVGIEALQPDLVILDEFQRFRTLLDPSDQSWATRLARKLFDFQAKDTGRRTRTLLLSATPYRPYTTADDADGDSHFEDFVQTARFLLDDDLSAEALRADLRDLRRSLLCIDRDHGAAAAAACERVGSRLRPVMARTERLASTPDRNGMLQEMVLPVSLERSDVDGYVAAAAASKLLGDRDIVEFWKSGPYLLNFMEGYALKHAFESAVEAGTDTTDLKALIARGRGFLDWSEISRYQRVDPANSRLRALAEDTIGRGMWQLLWLPPSLPYYDAGGIFDAPSAASFTKRLVFSAWHLVPKVISALLSYEAERHIFSSVVERQDRGYAEYTQRPDRLLDFRIDSGAPAAMTSLNTVVPYVALAQLVDPLAISARLRKEGAEVTRAAVEVYACESITSSLLPLLTEAPREGQVDLRWYWAAPLLLELAAEPEHTRRWWTKKVAPALWSGADSKEDDTSGFRLHLEAARDLICAPADMNLGRPPDDLPEVVTAVALGSPAICALRSLARMTGLPIDHANDLMPGAARIAWGFRSLFNGPDATAIVRSVSTPDAAYWRAALDYGISGNLQAVLDEYLHVLKEWLGFGATTGAGIASDMADTVYSAISLRTVSYRTDIPTVDSGAINVARHSMRGRFAIRFGDQTIEGEAQQQRAQQASQAFNSPFWPFVMTTTSVGQEGLDFHLYSHAVVHWNLPNNPVDFEQREGRVHRYKGHAIRKNVAYAYAGSAFDCDEHDPWAVMFEDARSEQTNGAGDLSPYWIYAPDGAPARIERYVPVLPLSRDAGRLEDLLKAVATYRLSFGQPRQEELMRYLAGRASAETLLKLQSSLKVNLSPSTNFGTTTGIET